MGPYTEVVIATRADDTDNDTTDKGWHIYGQLIVLLYCFIGISISVSYIVYCTWDYIGLIIAGGLVGLGFWACCRLGTDKSMFDRFRYRTLTLDERIRIKRRLSDKV
jgi:hypothetical protein